MTIEPEVLKKIGIYEEPNSAFAVSSAGTPANYLDFPYEEGSVTIDGDQPLLDPMAGKIKMDAMSIQVLGATKCSVSLKTVLHSHGLDLTGTAPAPTIATWALLRALKAMLGGTVARASGGATAVVVGTTLSTVTVTAGRGADFQKGGVIACQTAAGSPLIEAREIKSVTGDVITVKESFSAIPATGTAVRGGVTVHMTSDPDTSLQFLVEGRELSDRFVFCGLQGGLTIELPFGQATSLAKLAMSFTGPFWSRLADGGAVPAGPSYPVFQPVRNVDAELTVPTVGAVPRVLVHQTEIKIELPGLAYEDVGSGAGVQGVRRKRRMPGRPLVRGSFTTPFEDQAWFQAFENRTAHAVFQQVGNLPGQTVLFSVPTVQLGQPKRAAAGGIAALMVPFIGRNDEDVATPTTDLHDSAFRIHFV